MSRPKTYTETRTSTSVRLPSTLYDRLHAAAEERDLSANFLMTAAIEDYLARLVPVDEWKRSLTNEAPR